MTSPRIFLLRMVIFLAMVVVLVAVLFRPLVLAFDNNVPLNSLIVFVLLFGCAWTMVQVARLTPEVRWVEMVQRQPTSLGTRAPRLLAPMAQMLHVRAGRGGEVDQSRFTLSAPAMRSLMDGALRAGWTRAASCRDT